MTKQVTVGQLGVDAKRVLGQVELRDIRLASLSCHGSDPILDGPFSVTSDVRVRGRKVGSDTVQTSARYSVVALTQPDDGETAEAWSVTLEMLAEYHAGTDELPAFSDGELTAFALLVGLMAIHPYARETVQSVSGRLGYPPFTDELLEPMSAWPEDSVIELTAEEPETTPATSL